MDITNFMIGELVFDEDGKNPHRITRSEILKALTSDTVVEVQPIPLSVEYIENNGYEFIDSELNRRLNVKEWRSKDHQVIIRSGFANRDNDAWSVHMDNEYFESTGSADVFYLHEIERLFTITGYNGNRFSIE